MTRYVIGRILQAIVVLWAAYTVAFAVSAGVFVLAAVLCGSLIRKHPPQTSAPQADASPASPVLAARTD